MAINRSPTVSAPAVAVPSQSAPASEAQANPPRVTPPPAAEGTAAAAKAGVLYKLPSGLQGTFICQVNVAGGDKFSFATGGKPELLEAGAVILEVPTASVVPPDAPPRVSKRHNIVDEVPSSPPAIEQAPAAPAPEVVPEKPVTEETAPAAKRGRPAGSKNRPKDAVVETKTGVIETPQGAVVAVDLSGVKVEVTPSTAPAASDVRLYFGCAPVGVVTQSLYAHMEALESLVIRTAAQHGASAMAEGDDLRTAEGSALGFGKWVAYLAEVAKSALPPPGHYVVDLGVDSRIDCVANEIARSLPAGAVVRGVW